MVNGNEFKKHHGRRERTKTRIDDGRRPTDSNYSGGAGFRSRSSRAHALAPESGEEVFGVGAGLAAGRGAENSPRYARLEPAFAAGESLRYFPSRVQARCGDCGGRLGRHSPRLGRMAQLRCPARNTRAQATALRVAKPSAGPGLLCRTTCGRSAARKSPARRKSCCVTTSAITLRWRSVCWINRPRKHRKS